MLRFFKPIQQTAIGTESLCLLCRIGVLILRE